MNTQGERSSKAVRDEADWSTCQPALCWVSNLDRSNSELIKKKIWSQSPAAPATQVQRAGSPLPSEQPGQVAHSPLLLPESGLSGLNESTFGMLF